MWLSKKKVYYEPSPRFAPFAAVVEGKFYVWGGATKDSSWRKKEYAATVEIFDPGPDTWSASTTSTNGEVPPYAIYDGASASMDNHLYIVGGITAVTKNSILYKLDVHTWTWTLEAPGFNLVSHTSILCHNGTIVLSGYELSADEDLEKEYVLRVVSVDSSCKANQVLLCLCYFLVFCFV